MDVIKKFLTDIDLFGIPIAFRYKNRIKYKSPLGGFSLVLFLILLFSLAIYYFIPFFNRKNYTVVYYTMNLASTEEVNLFSSGSNFAFGLSCEGKDSEKYTIEDLLYLQTKFIVYTKSLDGNYVKYPYDLGTHNCNYDDFFNKYDKQVDYLGLQEFKCLNDKNYQIQGIYSDQIFSYFEISALAKNTSTELLEEIERFLFENDCKFHMAFTDIIIDLDNYENPMTQYLNDEIFIQLNPTSFIKKNIYFMNQEFTNDNYLLFIIGDDETPETKILYSRYEEYILWKGLNRAENKPDYYNYFSKVYIRADLKKTVIKRKYQKFMEFFADSFSLLSAIFQVLSIFFYFIYNFEAYYLLSKKLFFFKEVDNESNFNIIKKINQIQELINITDIRGKKSEINSFDTKTKDIHRNNNYSLKKSYSEHIEIINNNERTKKEIKIYDNQKKELYFKQVNYYSKPKESQKENNNEISNYQMENEDHSKNKFNDNYQKYNMNFMKINKNKERIHHFKMSDRDKVFLDETIKTSVEDSSSEIDKPKTNKRIKYSFNIFEIIIILLFNCCLPKNMNTKNKVNEKSNEIIYEKMDILTFIRNSILFDLIHKSIIDNDNIQIINFLCRPIISINKKEKNKFNSFYKKYKEKDFNKFSEKIVELTEKSKERGEQIKYISLSHEHLKTFI